MTKISNIFIITGPTCSGKTNISLKIAQYIPEIEIISADSMQIYKHMNIGTAKPNNNILQQYKHHCINIADPANSFDVMRYTRKAQKCIADIFSRHKKPLIVGGTGLYIKSFLNPFFEGPGRSDNIRSKLNKLLENKGNIFLFNLLKKYDPVYSQKINHNDSKRIIRALEVYYLTGKPISYYHKINQDNLNTYDVSKKTLNYYTICLYMDRKKLYEKINQRVELMIKKGLIEETKELLKNYDQSNNAMQGLGYKQIALYLKGIISREEAIETIKKETRHFAKRQLSWFKNQIKVDCWINLDNYNNYQECAKKIVDIMKKKGY